MNFPFIVIQYLIKQYFPDGDFLYKDFCIKYPNILDIIMENMYYERARNHTNLIKYDRT